jgi:hypothetical protein
MGQGQPGQYIHETPSNYWLDVIAHVPYPSYTRKHINEHPGPGQSGVKRGPVSETNKAR